MNTTIDVTNLITQVLEPIAIALGAVLAGWVSKKAVDWFGLQNNTQLASNLEKAMTNGLAFAQNQLNVKLSEEPVKINVGSNPMVQMAAQYVNEHMKDELTQLGVTPQALAEKLTARLALNTTPPEQSAAVPTPPAPAVAAAVASPTEPAAAVVVTSNPKE